MAPAFCEELKRARLRVATDRATSDIALHMQRTGDHPRRVDGRVCRLWSQSGTRRFVRSGVGRGPIRRVRSPFSAAAIPILARTCEKRRRDGMSERGSNREGGGARHPDSRSRRRADRRPPAVRHASPGLTPHTRSRLRTCSATWRSCPPPRQGSSTMRSRPSYGRPLCPACADSDHCRTPAATPTACLATPSFARSSSSEARTP